LHLESRRRNYPTIPILIHDDRSQHLCRLAELCQQYGASFSSNEERLGHNLGDLSAYESGFTWALKLEVDILVKMSRRFIPLYDWVPELQTLSYLTQYATFSNLDRSEGLGFRTECVGFHVTTWVQAGLVSEITRQICTKQPTDILIEAVIHKLARKANQLACRRNRDFVKEHPRPTDSDAYGIWELLGTNRREKLPLVLWHHACDPVEYCRALHQYQTLYELSKWRDIRTV